MEVLGKNGKPLYGAAKQAMLRKQLAWQDDEIEVFLVSVDDRISRLERQTKYLPIAVIVALFVGCATGKLIKPDLAVMAVGCAGAGAGMMTAIARHK